VVLSAYELGGSNAGGKPDERQKSAENSAAGDFARLTTLRALDTSERVLIPADER
jgi:hypothetical protein